MGTLALGFPVRRYLRPFETLIPDTGHAWHTKKNPGGVHRGPPKLLDVFYLPGPQYQGSSKASSQGFEVAPKPTWVIHPEPAR
jgi:hypothetical protein